MRVRKDVLTSQKIETALIFKQMLGVQDAYDYLRGREVPDLTIERVLFGGKRRSSMVTLSLYNPDSLSSPPTGLNGAFYFSSGRRKDILRMAVVQAALVLRSQLGDHRVEQMLRREKLPDEVITRVLRGETGTLRTRRGALPVE